MNFWVGGATSETGGGGSLYYMNAPFEGALQWGTLTLHIVPQGHGGGYIYIYTYIYTYVSISIYLYVFICYTDVVNILRWSVIDV